jgi:mRNA interferase MazF
MTAFKRGDVVLVAFPFTDLTTTKMRPAVIVSSDAFNQNHLDIVLAAITSQVPKRVARYDHLLSLPDQKDAGLPKPSVVKTWENRHN